MYFPAKPSAWRLFTTIYKPDHRLEGLIACRTADGEARLNWLNLKGQAAQTSEKQMWFLIVAWPTNSRMHVKQNVQKMQMLKVVFLHVLQVVSKTAVIMRD